jgi:hypothetical protein
MKRIAIIISIIAAVGLGLFYQLNKGDSTEEKDQQVLAMVLEQSREYAALRYETDNILLNARDYSSYEDWNIEMKQIITRWQTLETDSEELLSLAETMSEAKISFDLTSTAHAYDKQEISDIFDRAPAGKKIATLAKHLNVDAKTAYGILQKGQTEVANAWNKTGDNFKALEISATLIKDGCKITTFVGAIALTGGTAALAAESMLAQAAVVVAGADLALEVTDDAAKIALGDKNRVSTIVGSARVVTEPVAAILMISTLPANLTKGIEKLGAVSFGAEQLNSTIQEGKVIGIKIPAATRTPSEQKLEVSVLAPDEVEQWVENEAGPLVEITQEDIEETLNVGGTNETESEIPVAENKATNTNTESSNTTSEGTSSTNNSQVVGIWEGIISFTQSTEAEEQAMDFVLEIKPNGDLGGEAGETYESWELVDGNSLRLIASSDEWEGYDEFRLSGNSLTYVKRAGINSEGVWQEDFAGSDFFGGKFMEIYLEKI